MSSTRPYGIRPATELESRSEGLAEPAWPDGSVSGRREAIWLALAAAEVCWVTPVFLALNRARNPHSPVLLWLGILILMLGYFYFYRALLAANLTLRCQQGLLVVGLLLSAAFILRFHVYAGLGLQGVDWFLTPLRSLADAAVVMPRGWVTVMILVYLWARAIHLANRSVTADRVGFSFRSGVVILIAVALFARVFTGVDVSGYIVAYFFFALLAVALARIEEVSLLPNSSPVPFSGFWIGSSIGAVTVLVLLSMLVALFFYGGGLRQVLKWLSPVVLVVQIIIVSLGALSLMLLDWILAQFSVDLSVLGQGLREAFQRLGQLLAFAPSVPPSSGEEQVRPLILGILQAGITIAIPAAIIALVLLFTWRRMRAGRREKAEDEARESLLSARAVARNLQAMIQDGLDRLGELAGLVRRFGPSSRFLAAVSIRRIYTNLVRLATDAGYPRARAQTPYEYLQVLHEALPGSKEDVALITEAYVNAHYGQVPDSREELQRIRDCWERIRTRAAKKDKGPQQ
jgi:hypothetical protein